MKLYFIGGASGSGKTAVIPYLKELLVDAIAVYDFDDIGVPEDADKRWRQESTEKWLKKLLGGGKDACLLGQIVLGEILSCPSVLDDSKNVTPMALIKTCLAGLLGFVCTTSIHNGQHTLFKETPPI
jgi:hypothetical protein